MSDWTGTGSVSTITPESTGKTLWDIRRAIGDRLQIMHSGVVDADPSGDAGTGMQDADVIPIIKDNWYNNQFVYFGSLSSTLGSRTRRVTTQVGGNVLLTPGLGVSTEGQAYELWKTFDPRRVNGAINTLLTSKAVYTDEQFSNLVAAQYTGYAVTSLAERILSVAYLDPDNLVYYDIAGWRERGYPGSITFDLTGDALNLPASYPATTLRIAYERHYPSLDTEGATTNCSTAWLEAAAIAELYIEMLPRTQKADRDQIKENIALFAAEAERKAGNRNGPTVGPRGRITQKVSD